MKWFKRTRWLFAWCVWFWLGFGLYRELPRGFGPRACKLPVGNGNSVLGFVGDADVVAVQVASGRPSGQGLSLFDARNGDETSQRPMPRLPPTVMLGMPSGGSVAPRQAVVEQSPGTLRYGSILGMRGDSKGPRDGLYAFDVMKGEWKPLTSRWVRQVALHPRRPWAAIIEDDARGVADRLIVADYQTGDVLLSNPLPDRASLYARPFFISDRDILVLPFSVPNEKDPIARDSVLQAWKIAEPPTLEQEWRGDDAPPMMPYSVSNGGRILFVGRFESDAPDAKWVDVYDFNEKRYLSTTPPSEQPRKQDGVYTHSVESQAMVIAPSGRAALKFGSAARFRVLRPGKAVAKRVPESLNEVGTGRTIWRLAPLYESLVDASADGFLVRERWQEIWKDWFPNLKFQSFARRSMETGELLDRTRDSIRFDPRNINANRTLVILADGSVHPWPLRVDWLLLTLCQTILAAPLLLLWAIMRWRRKRMERRSASA